MYELRDYLDLNCDVIFATALSQVLNLNGEYYYRLKNHSKFLSKLNINFSNYLLSHTQYL